MTERLAPSTHACTQSTGTSRGFVVHCGFVYLFIFCVTCEYSGVNLLQTTRAVSLSK